MNGKRLGQGVLICPSEEANEGEWKNGQRNDESLQILEL
jgi:hypothetical protein